MGYDTISQLQERLTGALIGLARSTEGNEHLLSSTTAAAMLAGLIATRENGDHDEPALLGLLDRVDQEKRKLVPSCYLCASPCGRTDNYHMQRLQDAPGAIQELKLRILSGIRELAAAPGEKDDALCMFLYRALFFIGMDDAGAEELLPILQELESLRQ